LRICGITNVYNEQFNLPIWLNYYGKQFGVENCFIINHGSDDGSVDNIGESVRIDMVRSPLSDSKRAEFISDFVNSLLHIYDAAVYTDCDEILVAAPQKYSGLRHFVEEMQSPTATAIGLNIVHNLAVEGALDDSLPILRQRRHAQFVTPMCKTLITQKPIRWSAGFHGCSFPPNFSDLFLFHTRWVDLGESLKRLTLTRSMQYESPNAAPHQRLPYLHYLKHFESIAGKEVVDNFDFSNFVADIVQSTVMTQNGIYHSKIDVRSQNVVKIPEIFNDVF
jgi:hypothetical protein